MSLITIQSLIILKTLVMHPVHVSVATIDINVEQRVFECTFKLFSDDFENIVNQKYDAGLQLTSQVDPGEGIRYINQYIESSFQLTVNGREVAQLDYLRHQMNEESIWLFYSFESEKKIRSVSIINSLLCDLFADQTNLVIVTWEDKQNGYRLNNKNREISFKL